MERLPHSAIPMLIYSDYRSCPYGSKIWKVGKAVRYCKGSSKSWEWKKALRIAKDFRINVTKAQRDTMARAYECIVHPEFYKQIGIDIPRAIEKGIEVVSCLYGE